MLQSLVLKTLISLELNCLGIIAYWSFVSGNKEFYYINKGIYFYIKGQKLPYWFWHLPHPSVPKGAIIETT